MTKKSTPLPVSTTPPLMVAMSPLSIITAALRALRDQVGRSSWRAEMPKRWPSHWRPAARLRVRAPGTASRRCCAALPPARRQVLPLVLNPDITREDLVGPLDPAVRNGEWRRKWSKFATRDIAFLDEIWKASPQVANMLLDGLEERC